MKLNIFEQVLIHAMLTFCLLLILIEVWLLFSISTFILLGIGIVFSYLMVVRLFYRKISIKKYFLHVMFNVFGLLIIFLGSVFIKFLVLRVTFGENMVLIDDMDEMKYLEQFEFIIVFYYLLVIFIVCTIYEWYFAHKKIKQSK